MLSPDGLSWQAVAVDRSSISEGPLLTAGGKGLTPPASVRGRATELSV